MSDSNETSKKIQELQVLEHNHQAFLMQKQKMQLELNEVLNALDEVSNSKGEIYKVLGGIMMQADKEKTLKELEEKKKVLEMRISAIEKQEQIIDEKISAIKKEITVLVGKTDK